MKLLKKKTTTKRISVERPVPALRAKGKQGHCGHVSHCGHVTHCGHVHHCGH